MKAQKQQPTIKSLMSELVDMERKFPAEAGTLNLNYLGKSPDPEMDFVLLQVGICNIDDSFYKSVKIWGKKGYKKGSMKELRGIIEKLKREAKEKKKCQ